MPHVRRYVVRFTIRSIAIQLCTAVSRFVRRRSEARTEASLAVYITELIRMALCQRPAAVSPWPVLVRGQQRILNISYSFMVHCSERCACTEALLAGSVRGLLGTVVASAGLSVHDHTCELCGRHAGCVAHVSAPLY